MSRVLHTKTGPWDNFWRTTQLWKKKKKSQPRTLAAQRARETWTFKSDFDARSSLSPVGTLATTPTPPRRGHSTHQSLGCSNWGKTDWESRGSSNPLLLPGSQSLWSQARTPGPHHWCSQSENHPAETPGASGRPRLAAPGWARGPAGGPWASWPCCQEPVRPPARLAQPSPCKDWGWRICSYSLF